VTVVSSTERPGLGSSRTPVVPVILPLVGRRLLPHNGTTALTTAGNTAQQILAGVGSSPRRLPPDSEPLLESLPFLWGENGRKEPGALNQLLLGITLSGFLALNQSPGQCLIDLHPLQGKGSKGSALPTQVTQLSQLVGNTFVTQILLHR
jgi:hypothetical protein